MLGTLETVSAKDVMILLGCSLPTAYRKLKKIKNTKNDPNNAIITLKEFCDFYEIKKTA